MILKNTPIKRGGGITVPSVGDTYTLGSAAVTILGVNSGEDTNDTSIVLKIQYGETSFLVTGDAERPAEQAILGSGADLSAMVLKVGNMAVTAVLRIRSCVKSCPLMPLFWLGRGMVTSIPLMIF